MKNLTTILIISIVYLIGLFVGCSKREVKYITTTDKETVTRLKEQIDSLKIDVLPIEKQVQIEKVEIIKYKTLKDTVNIIEYQDRVIEKLDTIVIIKNKIIQKQDTVITQMESVNRVHDLETKALTKQLRNEKLKKWGVGLLGIVGITFVILK